MVARADGTEARYVIDFYAGKIAPGSNVPVGMHLDVRPALDSVDVRKKDEPKKHFDVCDMRRLSFLPSVEKTLRVRHEIRPSTARSVGLVPSYDTRS